MTGHDSEEPSAAQVVEVPIMEKVMLPCTMGDACEYVTPELGVEYAMQLLDKHLLGVHEHGLSIQ